MKQLKNNNDEHAGYLHEINHGRFGGLTFIQTTSKVDYPDPEIPEKHSRQIVQRMTPGELDRRLTPVKVDQPEKLTFIPGQTLDRYWNGTAWVDDPILIEQPEGKPHSESPEEWEGLKWIGYYDLSYKQVDNDLIADIKYFNNFFPCEIGTYDDFNFNDKLTIRLGRLSETEWVWQILAQDERFRAIDKNIDYKNVHSWAFADIYLDDIILRGSHRHNDNNINHFAADAERMHEIFSQLHDWSLNWEGWAE